MQTLHDSLLFTPTLRLFRAYVSNRFRSNQCIHLDAIAVRSTHTATQCQGTTVRRKSVPGHIFVFPHLIVPLLSLHTHRKTVRTMGTVLTVSITAPLLVALRTLRSLSTPCRRDANLCFSTLFHGTAYLCYAGAMPMRYGSTLILARP